MRDKHYDRRFQTPAYDLIVVHFESPSNTALHNCHSSQLQQYVCIRKLSLHTV